MQQPLFTVAESGWQPPKLDSLPSWAGAKRVAVDCETRDPDLRKLGPRELEALGGHPNRIVRGMD